MSESLRKIGVSLLLAVFALFVGANTFCIHTHVDDGVIVAHSHPYLPSAHHTHSGAQMASVAIINALSFDDCLGGVDFHSVPVADCGISLGFSVSEGFCLRSCDTAVRRGPPAL